MEPGVVAPDVVPQEGIVLLGGTSHVDGEPMGGELEPRDLSLLLFFLLYRLGGEVGGKLLPVGMVQEPPPVQFQGGQLRFYVGHLLFHPLFSPRALAAFL